jgi:1,4-alpha-glucan branching enzyme
MKGERLGHLLDFEGLKVAPGVRLLSWFLLLLFMGEECGETSPFQYFVSSDGLVRVRLSRSVRPLPASCFVSGRFHFAFYRFDDRGKT